jgi:hypothetical protein
MVAITQERIEDGASLRDGSANTSEQTHATMDRAMQEHTTREDLQILARIYQLNQTYLKQPVAHPLCLFFFSLS